MSYLESPVHSTTMTHIWAPALTPLIFTKKDFVPDLDVEPCSSAGCSNSLADLDMKGGPFVTLSNVDQRREPKCLKVGFGVSKRPQGN